MSIAGGLPTFRVGDHVYVKTEAEILSTLDADGCLDGLPFMPEMLRYCGQRLRVSKTAHKTCDTIDGSGGRRMRDAVHLDDLRCDGSAHGGCEAGCTLFWKTVWLRGVEDTQEAAPSIAAAATSATRETLHRATQRVGLDPEDPSYRCQTTELLRATTALAGSDVSQYVQDVVGGNHSFKDMIRLLIFTGYRRLVETGVAYRILIRLYNGFQGLRGGDPFPVYNGRIPLGQATPNEALDLRPGERVKVRPIHEIEVTLNRSGFNRGMRFDTEMVKYCGREYVVKGRVRQIINEKSGKMMQMKSPCVLLADVSCKAECTTGRVGCPRAVNTYWREIWLKRIER